MLALVNGDYQPSGNGLRTVTGDAALLQRILLKLTAHRGRFPAAPAAEVLAMDCRLLSLHLRRGVQSGSAYGAEGGKRGAGRERRHGEADRLRQRERHADDSGSSAAIGGVKT